MAEEKKTAYESASVYRAQPARRSDPPPDTEKLKSQLTRRAVIAPILTAVMMALLLASKLVDTSLYSQRDNIYLSVIIIQLMAMALPAMFYLRLKGTGAVMKLNFKALGVRHIRYIIDMAALLICSTLLIKIAMYRLGTYTGEFTFLGRFVPYGSVRTDFAGITYLILAFAVVPAVVEEFVFRSLIWCEYQSLAGGIIAALVTSLMYSLLGFSFTQLPLYFLVGVIMSCLVSVTGSIWSALIVRLIYNLLSLLFEYNVSTLLRTSGSLVFAAIIITALTALFAFLSISQAEKMFEEKADRGDKKPDFAAVSFGRRSFITFFSPTLMLCVIIFVVGIIMAARGML